MKCLLVTRDMLRDELNKKLGLGEKDGLALAQVLEAASWKGGREIAKAKRAGGGRESGVMTSPAGLTGLQLLSISSATAQCSDRTLTPGQMGCTTSTAIVVVAAARFDHAVHIVDLIHHRNEPIDQEQPVYAHTKLQSIPQDEPSTRSSPERPFNGLATLLDPSAPLVAACAYPHSPLGAS